MVKGWIYIIRNRKNSKVYIGQTHMSIRLRFQDHLSAARHGKDYVIGKAIRKYGENNFYIETIEECIADTIKELTNILNKRELHWIKFFNSANPKFGYNMSIGGNVTRNSKELDESLVLKLFAEGMTSYKIAKYLHFGTSKISNILRRNNIVFGIEKQRRSDEKDIIISYVSGNTTMNICRQFNVNKSTVRRILLRNNIELRSKSKNKNSERDPQTLNNISDPRELCA